MHSVSVSASTQQSDHPETIRLWLGLVPLCMDDFASQPKGVANPAFF